MIARITLIFLRRALLPLLILSSTMARASPEYMDKLLKVYKLSESSRIAGRSCANCHVSGEDFSLNPYGKDLKGQIKLPGAPLAASNLTAIEANDSDGDGAPNGDELRADSLPSDPTSYPEGFMPTAAPGPRRKAEAEPLIPRNAFHPAMVHFPIGLFIAGLFLDLLGMIAGRRELLFAGWCNLVLAAVSGLAGIVTGFVAATFMKFPLKGIVLNHLVLATISVAVMWVLVSMRLHRHEKMNLGLRVVYYVLALAAIVTLSYGGHLGGVLVYGE